MNDFFNSTQNEAWFEFYSYNEKIMENIKREISYCIYIYIYIYIYISVIKWIQFLQYSNTYWVYDQSPTLARNGEDHGYIRMDKYLHWYEAFWV
jgi:hypothetical protein